jgi:hypothetical protein
MSNGLRDHPTNQIVFQWTLPRQTPEADTRVELAQEFIEKKSGTGCHGESEKIVLVRLHS